MSDLEILKRLFREYTKHILGKFFYQFSFQF